MDAVAASGPLALTAATPSMSLRPGMVRLPRWVDGRSNAAVACRWVPADGCVTSCHRFLMAQPALCAMPGAVSHHQHRQPVLSCGKLAGPAITNYSTRAASFLTSPSRARSDADCCLTQRLRRPEDGTAPPRSASFAWRSTACLTCQRDSLPPCMRGRWARC